MGVIYAEMNMAPLHIFALLYQRTHEQKYLDFALKITNDLTIPGAGDYIRCAQEGLEYYQGPKPRWESLHIIMGIAALYAVSYTHLLNSGQGEQMLKNRIN